jgi:hypothetical protein
LTGTLAASRPTFTVSNIVRLGTPGTLIYTFEIALNPSFSPVAISGMVSEGSGQTSFTPATDLAASVTYYWRATATDPTNSLSSPPSTTQFFTAAARTRQELLAAEEGLALWPGVQPTSSTGQAVMGNGWEVRNVGSFTGVLFLSPPLEMLQVFDLIDRGFDPQGAIDWMHSNGYPTTGAYFRSIGVIGFPFEYLALDNGRWDLIVRIGG